MKDLTLSPPATLESKLAEGRFVITAEVAPPLTASAALFVERVKPLAGLIDAVNVTDAASARAALSSFAASAILGSAGFEPVLQTTCRDRNRIALSGDLLGAAAQGVRNLLVLHGDDPRTGDMPDAKPVYDLDSRAVMALARDMRDSGRLPSGREIVSPPHFFIGCADAPIDPPDNWEPKGLEAKIAAGAQFAQTQFCFDAELAERYFARLDELGITKRLKVIAGIGPLLSAKQARFMNEKLFGVSIPAAIIERLEATSDPKAEGRAICVELIERLRAMKGVSGVHIMAPLQSPEAIADTVKLGGWR